MLGLKFFNDENDRAISQSANPITTTLKLVHELKMRS